MNECANHNQWFNLRLVSPFGSFRVGQSSRRCLFPAVRARCSTSMRPMTRAFMPVDSRRIFSGLHPRPGWDIFGQVRNACVFHQWLSWRKVEQSLESLESFMVLEVFIFSAFRLLFTSRVWAWAARSLMGTLSHSCRVVWVLVGPGLLCDSCVRSVKYNF